MHVHDFPNLFVVGPSQGSNLISNITQNLTEAGTTIAKILNHGRSLGAERVEVTEDAERAWVAMLENSQRAFLGNPDARLLQQRGTADRAQGTAQRIRVSRGAGRLLAVPRALARRRRLRRAHVRLRVDGPGAAPDVPTMHLAARPMGGVGRRTTHHAVDTRHPVLGEP